MMTIEAVADLLNVHCQYVVKQIEAGVLPCQGEGDERRIPVEAALAYKRRLDEESARAMDELVALSEELGLYP